jgi:predicted Rossmann-fold nucleotide-binding protein
LIRQGDGYVACTGGTGTLVELAVVWEMLNKNVICEKPLVALGEFWRPIIERVREVECAGASPWGENGKRLIEIAQSPAAAAEYLSERLQFSRIRQK